MKTVEGTIIKVLRDLQIIDNLKEAQYNAAGRTDKGVNALSQVIAFNSLKRKIYLEEINQFLPNDIYVYGLAKVPENFNARKNAIRRIYRYYYPQIEEMNFTVMKKGMKKFEGHHDFINLCKRPEKKSNGYQKSTVLTMEKASLTKIKNQNMLQFEFISQSFLWNQVRKMVSLILDIGTGKYPLEIIEEILQPNRLRNKQGIQAIAPEGLVLYNVEYPNIIFEKIKKNKITKAQILKKLTTYNTLSQVLMVLRDNIL